MNDQDKMRCHHRGLNTDLKIYGPPSGPAQKIPPGQQVFMCTHPEQGYLVTFSDTLQLPYCKGCTLTPLTDRPAKLVGKL